MMVISNLVVKETRQCGRLSLAMAPDRVVLDSVGLQAMDILTKSPDQVLHNLLQTFETVEAPCE
jgi:hypothetical protein